MKIKVKSSGEVYYADCWENRDVRIDEEEIKGTIDWDAFRREVAKSCLAAMVVTDSGSMYPEPDGIAERAVRYADELIKQLEEEEA